MAKLASICQFTLLTFGLLCFMLSFAHSHHYVTLPRYLEVSSYGVQFSVFLYLWLVSYRRVQPPARPRVKRQVVPQKPDASVKVHSVGTEI
jgi:hypothetical protein